MVAPGLPLHDPDASYEQRAAPAIAALAGGEEPVVVVGHSLGAAYAPLVPGSLLVYLCPAPTGPFADSGLTLRASRAGFPRPAEDGRGVSVWDPDAAVAAMYGRLPRELAASVAAALHPGVSAPGAYPLTRHPDIPAALVYATKDEFFEPEWERQVAWKVLGVEAIEIPGGHFPMLEAPEELADLLVETYVQSLGSSPAA